MKQHECPHTSVSLLDATASYGDGLIYYITMKVCVICGHVISFEVIGHKFKLVQQCTGISNINSIEGEQIHVVQGAYCPVEK